MRKYFKVVTFGKTLNGTTYARIGQDYEIVVRDLTADRARNAADRETPTKHVVFPV